MHEKEDSMMQDTGRHSHERSTKRVGTYNNLCCCNIVMTHEIATEAEVCA